MVSHASNTKARLAWLTIVAHNLRFSNAVSMLVNQHRGACATRWSEQTKNLPSKLALNQADAGWSSANQKIAQEAQLTENYLLHQARQLSEKDKKGDEMMNGTRSNLSKLFGIESDEPSVQGHEISTDNLTTQTVNLYTHKQVGAVATTNKENADSQAPTSKTSRKKKQKHAGVVQQEQECFSWSEGQQAPIREITHYIQNLQLWINERDRPGSTATRPEPPNIMILGGPGSGKTAVISELNRLLTEADIPVLSSAMTAVAAGGMPNGQTVHMTYRIPVYQGKDRPKNEFLREIRSNAEARFVKVCNKARSDGMPVATIIDEISMMTCPMLGQILGRYSEFNEPELIPGPFIFEGVIPS